MSRHEQTHKIVAEASYVKLRNISSAMRRETILPGYCLLARWAWLVDCIINCPTSPQRRRREALVSELESTGNTQLHPRSPASFRTAFFFPFFSSVSDLLPSSYFCLLQTPDPLSAPFHLSLHHPRHSESKSPIALHGAASSRKPASARATEGSGPDPPVCPQPCLMHRLRPQYVVTQC